MRSDYRFWQRIETRSNDIDSRGHVNSVVYFAYFENVRIEYLRKIGMIRRKPAEMGPAVVSQTCGYKQQLFHPCAIDIACRTASMGNRSFTLEYEAYLEGTDTLICTGQTVMVWVDYTIPKAMPIPDASRAAIEELEGGPVPAA